MMLRKPHKCYLQTVSGKCKLTIRLKIFLLILTTSVAYGQTKKRRPISNYFLGFDIGATNDSIGAEMLTDKIYFIKGNLDTTKSKSTLDSIIWFFRKHSGVAAEMTLKKGIEVGGTEYRTTKIGRHQINQIESYLKSKMETSGVIITNFIYCGSPRISDENIDKLKSAARDKTIRLSLFIYDERQYDPNRPK